MIRLQLVMQNIMASSVSPVFSFLLLFLWHVFEFAGILAQTEIVGWSTNFVVQIMLRF